MENSVRERIKDVLKDKNMSINQLSKNINVVQATLNRQLNGFSKISQGTVNAILAYFDDVSPDWLVLGDGQMYKKRCDENVIIMDSELTVKERLIKFIKYNNLSARKFESILGFGNGFVNNIVKSIGAEKMQMILETFPNLNGDWLLHGKGEMLNNLENPTSSTLPLLPFEVIGGFPVGDNDGAMIEQCERYSVPDFVQRGAQFLVRVSGSSMYPKYSNGDILAVRRLKDVTFFQWGKVYVLDTSQGAIIKRVFPGEGNNIKCHSDNSNNYPDFDVSREDIRGVGIVVGCIRLE